VSGSASSFQTLSASANASALSESSHFNVIVKL
jgi:hypothetical protein